MVKAMRLLPKEQDWTAYVYLVYLACYLVLPFIFPSTAWDKAAVVAGTAAALPLYFWGFWLRGRQALWVVGGFVLLGSLLSPGNPTASVMFIYGASFIGKAFEQPRAWWYLGGLIALIGIEARLFHYPLSCWIPGIFFSAVVGSVIIQQYHRQRLTRQLLRAQEEIEHLARVAERERIGRDLHDLLGHTLSVIVLKAELASKLFSPDPERAQREISDVEAISRDALGQVRAAVRGYRLAGIAGEMRNARTALEAAGIQLEAAVEPPGLAPARETVVALDLREAVTNVVRHAQAKVCRIALRERGGYCELEVADDGRGGGMSEGSGLRGMRERVEAIGGAVELDGSGGTSLRVRVPV
jgi:two-component system sensor histidine kinase DesK